MGQSQSAVAEKKWTPFDTGITSIADADARAAHLPMTRDQLFRELSESAVIPVPGVMWIVIGYCQRSPAVIALAGARGEDATGYVEMNGLRTLPKRNEASALISAGGGSNRFRVAPLPHMSIGRATDGCECTGCVVIGHTLYVCGNDFDQSNLDGLRVRCDSLDLRPLASDDRPLQRGWEWKRIGDLNRIRKFPIAVSCYQQLLVFGSTQALRKQKAGAYLVRSLCKLRRPRCSDCVTGMISI